VIHNLKKKIFLLLSRHHSDHNNTRPLRPPVFLRSRCRIQKAQDYVFIDVCNLYILWPRFCPPGLECVYKGLVYIFDITSRVGRQYNVPPRLYCTNIIRRFVNRLHRGDHVSEISYFSVFFFFLLDSPN
jgi:hypothetical protein